jgi:hypothetical protein
VYRRGLGETPGLPSGRGTAGNPITLPGVEAKPTNAGAQVVMLLIVLALIYLIASDGKGG